MIHASLISCRFVKVQQGLDFTSSPTNCVSQEPFMPDSPIRLVVPSAALGSSLLDPGPTSVAPNPVWSSSLSGLVEFVGPFSTASMAFLAFSELAAAGPSCVCKTKSVMRVVPQHHIHDLFMCSPEGTAELLGFFRACCSGTILCLQHQECD